MERRAYPSDVSDGSDGDDERAFVAPYLILMSEDNAPWREHVVRAVFNRKEIGTCS